MTMQVILGHTGDGRSSPRQCREWRLDDYEWLEPHGKNVDEDADVAFSRIEGVERVWTDVMEQVRVEFPGGPTGTDAPAIPNVQIIEATAKSDD